MALVMTLRRLLGRWLLNALVFRLTHSTLAEAGFFLNLLIVHGVIRKDCQTQS